MNAEEALLNLCAEVAIQGGRIFTIVCDDYAAKLLHGDGANLYTPCGAVNVRVDEGEEARIKALLESGIITAEEAMRGVK